MASKSQETTQNLELLDDGKNGGRTENHTRSHDEFSLRLDQLNREFHSSLDLKSSSADSSLIVLNGGPNLSMKEPEVPDKMETKKCAVEMGTNGNENDSHLDLKLSPPGQDKTANESKSPSPATQDSCISVEVESNVNSENEGSTLIVMGCTFCLLYVMVPDADPKCPKCKNYGLLDVFRGNRPKRSRKN